MGMESGPSSPQEPLNYLLDFPKENSDIGSWDWMDSYLNYGMNVMEGEGNNTPRAMFPSSGHVIENEKNNTTLVDLEEEEAAAAIASKEHARKGDNKLLNITLDQLEPHFGKTLADAANDLGVSKSTLKRAKDRLGIARWPSHPLNKTNPSLFKAPTSTDLAGTSKDEIAIINAYYGDDKATFQFNAFPKFDKLVQEIASRFNINVGSFDLYFHANDNSLILARDDKDLQFCINKSKEYESKARDVDDLSPIINKLKEYMAKAQDVDDLTLIQNKSKECTRKVRDVDDLQLGINKSKERTRKTMVRIYVLPHPIVSNPRIEVGSSKRPRIVDHHRAPAAKLSIK